MMKEFIYRKSYFDERVIAVIEKVLGVKYPDTATSLYDLYARYTKMWSRG